MNVLIFGASGMVGQGVLRECLAATDVEKVTVVGRTPLPQDHPRLHQIVSPDLHAAAEQLADLPETIDACFFCLGVSSSGLSEAQYRALTYDLTLSVAAPLAKQKPSMTFIYVSGAGTDSSEKGKSMWARVKGRTENALLQQGFARVFLFRPGIIQPLHGVQSKTRSYRILYRLMSPLLPLLRKIFPDAVLSTEIIGKAMLNAARHGYVKPILETGDIARLARQHH